MTNPEQVENSQSGEASPEFRYAGLWRRLAAGFIDAILIFTVDGILWHFTRTSSGNGIMFAVLGASLRFLMLLGYFPVMESSRFHASVGKLILRIRVADAEGNPVTFLRAFGRNLAKVAFNVNLPLGIFFAATYILLNSTFYHIVLFAVLPFGLVTAMAVVVGPVSYLFNLLLTAFFAILLAGLLMIAFSRRKQCLHDFAARTIVVRK